MSGKKLKKLEDRNNKKISIILFVNIAGSILSFIFILLILNNNLIKPSQYKTSTIDRENPINIIIPKIGVDAPIETLGLNLEGAMEAPGGPINAGWYKDGPRPGEIGSAVIDGHSGWKDKTPAVFDNLHQLKIGDKIYIENGLGSITVFIVKEIKIYNPDADSTKVFVSNDGKSHLNLITCAGSWDIFKKSHTKRLIVFTDREN